MIEIMIVCIQRPTSTSTSEIPHHTGGDQCETSVDDSNQDVDYRSLAFSSTRSVGQFTLAVLSNLDIFLYFVSQ